MSSLLKSVLVITIFLQSAVPAVSLAISALFTFVKLDPPSALILLCSELVASIVEFITAIALSVLATVFLNIKVDVSVPSEDILPAAVKSGIECVVKKSISEVLTPDVSPPATQVISPEHKTITSKTKSSRELPELESIWQLAGLLISSPDVSVHNSSEVVDEVTLFRTVPDAISHLAYPPEIRTKFILLQEAQLLFVEVSAKVPVNKAAGFVSLFV